MEKQKNDTESKNAETTATVQGLAVQSTKTQMKFPAILSTYDLRVAWHKWWIYPQNHYTSRCPTRTRNKPKKRDKKGVGVVR